MQVFATDIDEDALEFARPGALPREHRRRRGPRASGEVLRQKRTGYQVSESLRNSVVFAVQNLITDPPFSKMDIISCRNL